MRNEHEASRRGSHTAIDDPIDLPDRSPDLNIRSGASIAVQIACDDSALRLRMRKRVISADGVAACTASPSARRATTSAVRLPSQSYTTNTGVPWRCAIDAAPVPSPGHCSREHSGASSVQIGALTHQSGATESRTLHFPLLACGDRHLVRVQA